MPYVCSRPVQRGWQTEEQEPQVTLKHSVAADQEDKMKAGLLWMVVVCLADGKVPQCSVGPSQVITVPKLSHISISCPSVTASISEVQYQLVFNGRNISQIYLERQSDAADSLFSSHFEVTANSSGEYVCKRTVVYPPPCTEDCRTTEVIVAEKQSLPIINDTVPGANQSFPVRTPFIPEEVTWAACGGLLIYSLSVTCVTVALWVKMKRNEEDSNVYVNTKPGEARKPYKA